MEDSAGSLALGTIASGAGLLVCLFGYHDEIAGVAVAAHDFAAAFGQQIADSVQALMMAGPEGWVTAGIAVAIAVD
jgi:hypothetical protein